MEDRAVEQERYLTATRQTADTFQAAATFLELCQIWGALDPDVSNRIKFAKYHAVRIVKAFKAGEDPNATNPAPKEEETPVAATEVQKFDASVAEQASKPRQPSVEEIPDESDRLARRLAHQSTLDESLHPSRTSSVPRPLAAEPDIPSVPRNAPGSPAQTMDIDPHSGGLELPSTPGTIGAVPNLPDTPGTSGIEAPNSSHHPNTFQSFPPPASASVPPPDPASFYDPSSASAHIPHPAVPPLTGPSVTRARAAPGPAPATGPSQPSHSVDDHSISLAQKHARWAVSALTFDDVETAVKELRNSLRYLGAA